MCHLAIETHLAQPSPDRARPAAAMAGVAAQCMQLQRAGTADEAADLQRRLNAQHGLWGSRRVRAALLEDLCRIQQAAA